MQGFALGFYKFAERATRMAYLNLLWIGFTILGLGLFGLMPATTAMFAVVRKWVRGETQFPIFKFFWETYKKEFVKTNGIGLIFFAIIYLQVIAFNILYFSESVVYNIAAFGVVAVFILLTIVLIYYFPIYVHFNLGRNSTYVKWALIIGIVHPLLTIAIIIGLGFIYYIVYKLALSILFIFFAGSLAAYVITAGVSKTFGKYEEEKSV